jgi:hypothetical protein
MKELKEEEIRNRIAKVLKNAEKYITECWLERLKNPQKFDEEFYCDGCEYIEICYEIQYN